MKFMFNNWKKDNDLIKEKVEECLERQENEWAWIEGYKATEADMTCRGYQYEIGKQYNIPDDEEVSECSNGFHLCLKLEDVFKYYDIGRNHRYFKVKALVRKNDVNQYGKHISTSTYLSNFSFGVEKRDKLVAKSIEFIRELSLDEILEDTIASNLHPDYKVYALEYGVDNAVHKARFDKELGELTALGYSTAFAGHLIDRNKTEVALAVGSQPDLSMDMKVLMIINSIV